MTLSNMTVFCYDLGLWMENCLRFVRDVKKVVYAVPNQSAFMEPFKSMIGKGMGMEIVSVDEWWDRLDEADFVFVPDNSCAGLVEFLKRHQYPVAGVGAVEKVETDRWYGRQCQQKNGLPVQSTIRVVGFSDMCRLMKEGGKGFGFPEFPSKFYVKVDNDYRGIEESFKHEGWASSEDTMYRIASKLGPFKEKIGFLAEELLDGVEPGLDGATWEGELMYPTMGGYEGKGVGIIERVYRGEGELPKAFQIIHRGLEPEFRKHKTRFFYSTEVKVGKDKVPYLIDPTFRLAGPGTAATQCELIENYTEVCCGFATGKRVDPVMHHKYAAACAFHSEEAVKDWVNIQFPKEMRRWIKFRMGCCMGGRYYAIPGFDSLGTVIGFGSTAKAAVEDVKEKMKEVKAKRIDTGIERLEGILGDIEEGQGRGVRF